MKTWRRFLLTVSYIVIDYAAIVLACYLAIACRNFVVFWSDSVYQVEARYIFGWLPFFFIVFLKLNGAYVAMRPFADLLQKIFYAVLEGIIAAILTLFFLQSSASTSRLFMSFLFLFGFIFLFLFRYIFLKISQRYKWFVEPVILIGAQKTAQQLLNYLSRDIGYRYEIFGVIDDDPGMLEEFPYLGNLHDAEKIVQHFENKIKTVLIAKPEMPNEILFDLIHKIQPYVKNFSFIPDLEIPLTAVRMDFLYNENLLLLRLKNNLAITANRVVKRAFDLISVILGGILISPFLIALAIIVAIDNHGKIIFAHRRVGRSGKIFKCYKFQTMYSNADKLLQDYLEKNPEARAEWEEHFKLLNDPRVTKLGDFLRRTSLDELPQLWNVLIGDMSLVGPRPITAQEIKKYAENIREYYLVRPGITGLWQVSGRSDTTYEERVAMDVWYVQNWSIWLDFIYLIKTVGVVVNQKGAY